MLMPHHDVRCPSAVVVHRNRMTMVSVEGGDPLENPIGCQFCRRDLNLSLQLDARDSSRAQRTHS